MTPRRKQLNLIAANLPRKCKRCDQGEQCTKILLKGTKDKILLLVCVRGNF